MTEPLLEATGLVKHYPIRRGTFGKSEGLLRAVDGVSLTVRRGETLGLVGESGSGKTTVARLLLRFEEPTSGSISFDGEDWLVPRGAALRARRRGMQIVFQDPQTSLNPRMRVAAQIGEPLLVQKLARARDLPGRVEQLLAEVGLPAAVAGRFPSELSGGQRQRVSIARAIATQPKLLVCDEAVSALDVSVAAQIVNLFLDLRERTGLAMLFIAHDLAVVARVSDRMAVMSLGRVVEEGPAAAVVARPLHPYTAALLSAVPEPDPDSRRSRIVLPGEPPSVAAPPPGCAFHPRCPIARPRCRVEVPPLVTSEGGRSSACFFPGELLPER